MIYGGVQKIKKTIKFLVSMTRGIGGSMNQNDKVMEEGTGKRIKPV